MRNLSLTKLWNNSLILEEKELYPRDYCRASELGQSIVDRYLRMIGTKPSNPPNDRTKGKFFAGRMWEWIAGIVLHQLGIIQTQQTETWTEDMPLRVRGHLDYLIGGIPDYNKARKFMSALPFDEETLERFMKVINNFEEEYGFDEITPTVHEIKSCSHYVVEMIQAGGSIDGHDLQIDHYLRGMKMDNGIIDYISKNDSVMAERLVKRSADIDRHLYLDLSTLKQYLDAKQQPPPAPLILFDNKFTKNFSVEYSQYLKLVYDFETPEAYRNSVQGKIASWNRVIKRLQSIDKGETTPTGKKILLTDKNKIAIEEMSKEGWNATELAKVASIVEDEEEILID